MLLILLATLLTLLAEDVKHVETQIIEFLTVVFVEYLLLFSIVSRECAKWATTVFQSGVLKPMHREFVLTAFLSMMRSTVWVLAVSRHVLKDRF